MAPLPRGSLIAFSGVDCAGKSTQIGKLSEALTARGHRVQVRWFRPGYSKELDGLRRLARRLRPGSLPSAKETTAREEIFNKPGVSGAWQAAALGDSLLQCAVKVRLRCAMGTTVICDRYLHDAALDLAFRFPDQEAKTRGIMVGVRALSPTPAFWLVMMLPHEEMLRRMEIKQEPFPDPPKVRDARFRAYQVLAQRPDATVIDADGSIDAVHQAVMAAIGEG